MKVLLNTTVTIPPKKNLPTTDEFKRMAEGLDGDAIASKLSLIRNSPDYRGQVLEAGSVVELDADIAKRLLEGGGVDGGPAAVRVDGREAAAVTGGEKATQRRATRKPRG